MDKIKRSKIVLLLPDKCRLSQPLKPSLCPEVSCPYLRVMLWKALVAVLTKKRTGVHSINQFYSQYFKLFIPDKVQAFTA
jgi:hypothetical protein